MSLWEIDDGGRLPSVVEGEEVDDDLPVTADVMTVTLVSGSLPDGLTIDGLRLTGEAPSVSDLTDYSFTLRATSPSETEDITLNISVLDSSIVQSQFITVDEIVTNGQPWIRVQPVSEYIVDYVLSREITIRDGKYTIVGFNGSRSIMYLDRPISVLRDLVVRFDQGPGSTSFVSYRIPEESASNYTGGSFRFQGNQYDIDAIDNIVIWRITSQGPIDNPTQPYELRGSKTWKKIYLTDNEYSSKYSNLQKFIDSEGEYVIDWWYINNCDGGWCCYADEMYVEGTSYYSINGNYYFDPETYQVPIVSDGPIPAHQRTLADERCFIEDSLSNELGTVIKTVVVNENELLVYLRDTPETRLKTNIQRAIWRVNDQIKTSASLEYVDIDFITLSPEDSLDTAISEGTDLTVALQRLTRFKVLSLDVQGPQIRWNTPSYLGRIQHDLVSRFAVSASFTESSESPIYELASGSLPEGLSLQRTGEITGRPYEFSGGTYSFSVSARDRFSEINSEKIFTIDVFNPHSIDFVDVYLRPLLDINSRKMFSEFIDRSNIFRADEIYRLRDPNYGIQRSLDMLVYAGIEETDLEKYYLATTQNHSRERYILGDFKVAEARESPDSDVVYEVVYISVIDPRDNGRAAMSKEIAGHGVVHKTSTSNMRSRINDIGQRERRRLPLWMRSSQNGFQELDYTRSIPICYVKPGYGERVIRRISDSGFKPNMIDYEADRYVVKNSSDYSNEEYVVFPR